MKEIILANLLELGFQIEKHEALGYEFEFEGLKYLYLVDEEDENYLVISIPWIYTIPESMEDVALEINEKINTTVKYVKSGVYNGTFWLSFEFQLFGNEDLDKLLRIMIEHLHNTYYSTCRVIRDRMESMSSVNKEDYTV